MRDRIFYTLYVAHDTFTFEFTRNGVEVGRIQLTAPLCHNQTVAVTPTTMTGDDLAGYRRLGDSSERLCREAFTMLREYMQGHSGFLPPSLQYGQMLFGMDLDDWDSI